MTSISQLHKPTILEADLSKEHYLKSTSTELELPKCFSGPPTLHFCSWSMKMMTQRWINLVYYIITFLLTCILMKIATLRCC